jgi:hypothetical protein
MTQAECLKQYPMEFMKYVILAIFLAGMFYITQMTLYLKQYTVFKIVGLQIVTIAYICFFYDTGYDLAAHGAYNRFILFVSLLIWAIIFTMCKIVSEWIRRKPIITVVLILLCTWCSLSSTQGI